jgi:integrase
MLANAFEVSWDPYPYIVLNLFLSMLAGLQGAILLIAAKRQDAIAAALAQHDYATGEQLVFGNGDRYTLTPSTRDGWYRSAIARAQCADESFPEPTLHDLRHTAASLAVSAGGWRGPR